MPSFTWTFTTFPASVDADFAAAADNWAAVYGPPPAPVAALFDLAVGQAKAVLTSMAAGTWTKAAVVVSGTAAVLNTGGTSEVLPSCTVQVAVQSY